MSKILVIQPHRMLQQAIALFLFPAHEVQMRDTVPESLSDNDFDAVIVDAVSLQETAGAASQTLRAVQNWRVPTIWIESGESSQAPQRDKLVLMKRPIAREALESSLAACLDTSIPPTAARDQAKAAKEKKDTPAAAPDSKVIDLVDVVEDDSGQKATGTQEKKKK